MSRPIYGVTVGTNMSPHKVLEQTGIDKSKANVIIETQGIDGSDSLPDCLEEKPVGLKIFGYMYVSENQTPESPCMFYPHDYQRITICDSLMEFYATLLGIPVTSGGNYTGSWMSGKQYLGDVVDFKTGKITHYLKMYRLSADSNWKYQSSTKRFYHGYSDMETGTGLPKAVCSHFKTVTRTSTDDLSMSFVHSSYPYYGFRYDALNGDIDAWKTFITENKVYVIGKLKKQTEEDIPVEVMEEYNNIILIPNGMIRDENYQYVEVEYLADTKAYIDKKFNELAKQLL